MDRSASLLMTRAGCRISRPRRQAPISRVVAPCNRIRAICSARHGPAGRADLPAGFPVCAEEQALLAHARRAAVQAVRVPGLHRQARDGVVRLVLPLRRQRPRARRADPGLAAAAPRQRRRLRRPCAGGDRARAADPLRRGRRARLAPRPAGVRRRDRDLAARAGAAPLPAEDRARNGGASRSRSSRARSTCCAARRASNGSTASRRSRRCAIRSPSGR